MTNKRAALTLGNDRHSAGSLSWPFPIQKYTYIFRVKYTEAILSISTRKLLWFEITKNAGCSLRK